MLNILLGTPMRSIDPSIFKAYDIRGIVGKTVDTDTARLIGRAFGSAARAKG
jgi:phosphomannomutase/phosphoglucomutase